MSLKKVLGGGWKLKRNSFWRILCVLTTEKKLEIDKIADLKRVEFYQKPDQKTKKKKKNLEICL